MQSAVYNVPFIQIKNLQAKFDTLVISNSFVTLIGDANEAHFLHQLHYWSYAQYGVVIDGIRWIYKPVREWLTEVFPFMTEWKLRKAIASLLDKGLIDRKKLYVKHHEIKHDNPYWNPKNQTYYYSVNYDKLQEMIDEAEQEIRAGSTENIRIEDSTKLSIEEFLDTKFCELSQNRTDITSIKNNPIQSHPTLPCESKKLNTVSQEESLDSLVNSEVKEIDSVNPEAIASKTDVPQVDKKINQNISTDKCGNNVVENATDNAVEQQVSEVAEPPKPVSRPKVKTPKGTKSVSKRMKLSPWKDEGQFKRFYRALIQALPIVANARSPQGLAQVIIRQLRSGIPHTYWDDFVAGLPIGTSTKPEWEVEPGVPYPMFIEYLTEKLRAGNNTKTDEQTRNEVFSILDKPRQAKAFWGQFKRSVVNVSEQVERDRALGVSNPNTPVWTRERIEPSIEEAAAAGKLITAANGDVQNAITAAKVHQLESKDSPPVSYSSSLPVPPSPEDFWNDSDRPQPTMREMLAARKVKGFCKPMPKASQAEVAAEERKQQKPKTNIAKMSLVEINDYLTDPVLRAQLTPQLFHSDYELITDYLGQIIGVKPPEDATEGRSSSSGE